MSVDVRRRLTAIIVTAAGALDALDDEHEQNMREAVADLASEANQLDLLVRGW